MPKDDCQKLRRCPFCGGEAIIVNEAIRENVYGKTIIGTAIGCRNCECHMFYRNRELAIEAWNKRVPPTINDIEEYIEKTHNDNMEMVAKLKRKYEVES